MHDPLPPELVARVTEFITAQLAPRLGLGAAQARIPVLDGVISDGGLGGDAAWQLFAERVAPNNVGLHSDRFLAFIPAAPSAAAVWMDAVVAAASFSAESWLEAPGAVAAEQQALRWLADLAGMPPSAGGAFVSGGTVGNLSALAVARDQAAGRGVALVGDSAHASIANSLRVLGIEALVVPTGPDNRLTADAARRAAVGHEVVAICAAGGSTNAGVIDDLDGLADLAAELGAWLHVDAAYGGAALLVDECRPLFRGIERADSVVIDPHKWLFATLGCGALLYRDPQLAVPVHRQAGPYIDIFQGADAGWNPSDYALQLTRRASGLPLWFALATYGVAAHRTAVRAGLDLARRAARRLESIDGVELVTEPQLSVVLFRRRGWRAAEWRSWAAALLAAGTAFVAPTAWRGEPVGRLVFLHPRTDESVIEEIADSLR